MVIDSSALLAILCQDPEANAYARAIEQDPIRLLSAVSVFETSVVIETRKGPVGGRDLDILLHRANIEIVSFSASQFEIAREAYRRYGKGRHPAALNLGDCCAYALARHSGEGLLAKGADFRKTDIIIAEIAE